MIWQLIRGWRSNNLESKLYVLNFPKKQTKNHYPEYFLKRRCSQKRFFVQFLGELRIPKSPFEINWPLEAIGGSFCGSASYNLIPLYSFFFHSQAQNIYPFFCLPELMRILNTYMPCRVDEIKFYYNCIFETFSLKSQFSIKHSHSVFGSV